MKSYQNRKNMAQIVSYAVLSLFLILLAGCKGRNLGDRLFGPDTSGSKDDVLVSQILACCYDNNNGVLAYPDFVPSSHVQLCEMARVAIRRDEKINGVVYIPMNSDCDPKFGHVGSEYYAGRGY